MAHGENRYPGVGVSTGRGLECKSMAMTALSHLPPEPRKHPPGHISGPT